MENCRSKKNRVHIISLGCPKNLVDSEVMASLLLKEGFRIVPSEEAADIILVNTCAFILPAKEESIGEILRVAEYKKQGRCAHLVVTGCLPQRYGAALERELPEVDLFMGPGEIPRIAAAVREMCTEPGAARTFTGPPRFLMDASFDRILSAPAFSAYLKIADGCDNRCSYCVVPSVRGRFRSRMPADVLREAERLARSGVKEIILTAQETTAYGRDLAGRPTLASLLEDLASIGDLQWIRILYTHPARITTELLEVIARHERICRYLDVPVQHIDDGILRSMGRRATGERIKKVIRRIRNIIPGCALRTSLIVGFPGETKDSFARLHAFMRETRFDHLGVFTYSREEGTKAAGLPRQVREATKESRRHTIMVEQATISREINESLVGTVGEALIEGPSNDRRFRYRGRMRRQSPDIDGVTYVTAREKKPGDIVTCKIVDVATYDLYAQEVR